MTKTQTATDTTTINQPAFIAWQVTERGEKTHWHKVGASWQHKDGKGMTLALDVLPLKGRIVLREPSDKDREERR